MRQHLLDGLTAELRDAHLLPVELAELFLLLRVGGRIDAIGEDGAQFSGQAAVSIAGIMSRARRNLRRQKRRHQTVLVRRPDAAVEPAERSACTFLTAEPQA